MKKITPLFLIAIALLLLKAGLTRTQDFPKPQGYVNDFAQIIQQDYGIRLESLLLELKEKTDAELVVMTMFEIGGEDYTEYANKLFSDWEILRLRLHFGF